MEEEKLKQIEHKYNNEKHELESLICEIEGKIAGYKESLKNINDNNDLSNNEYNNIIKKMKDSEEYLTEINRNYFNKKSIALEFIRITFKDKHKTVRIMIGDIKELISDVQKGSCYYINKKMDSKITAFDKKRSIEIKKDYLKLYNLNDSFYKEELENYKNKLKALTKSNIKNININIYVDGEKIENKEKKLKDIMKNLKKKVLKEAIEIISKKGKSQNHSVEEIDKVKDKINNLKKIFKSLKDLDFKNSKFNNGFGFPTKVEIFSIKFNSEFKDMIIGKMESLIKYYEEYDEQKKVINNNSKLFDDSFSLLKFEEKRPKIIDLDIKKFNEVQINYPYIALLSDSGKEKLLFGHNDYKLNIGPAITSLYSGSKFNYNIISFVNNNLLAKLDFKEDNDSKELKDYFSIKDKIPPTEPISVIFTVPKNVSKKNYTLTGTLEIMVEDSKIESLKIEFLFNIFLLPLEIIFFSKNELFWKENRFHIKKNSFIENEIIEFKYNIRNFENNKHFLYENFSLKNLDKNEVENEPEITQKERESNIIKIKLPIIDRKKKFFSGLFTLFFTDKMSIPIEISGYIKKPEFMIYYYDEIYDKIIKDNATIYIYKHQSKKKYFEKILHFKLQLFDEYKHKFKTFLESSINMEIYISFEDNENKHIIKGKPYIMNKDIKKELYFNIIIKSKSKPENTNFDILFTLDDVVKKFKIKMLVEDSKKDKFNRFCTFPYKIYINGKYDFVKNYRDIVESSKIIYNPFCEKLILAQKKVEPGNINIGKKFLNLIIFLDDFDNYWIPNDNYFGSNEFDKYKTIKIKSENIQVAKDNICYIFYDLYINDKNIIKRLFTNKINYEQIATNDRLENNKNFLNFIIWLISTKTKLIIKIEELKGVFQKMGKEILKDFSPFLSDNYEDSDELCSIIYYNIIIKLRAILIQRYNTLKENDFNLNKILRNENKPIYKNRLTKCFPAFEKEKFDIKINEEILKKEDYKEEKIESFNNWIIFENECYPKPIHDEIQINDNYSFEVKKVERKNIDINMDIIKILDLSNANNLDKRIAVLNNGFQICKAFMFCVEKLEKNKINETFNYLYEIYNQHKNFNNSILSKEIFNFKDAFESLCITLTNSGVNLSKFELPNLKNKKEITQAQKPRPNSFIFNKGIFWSQKRREKDKYAHLDLEKENEVNLSIEDNLPNILLDKNQEKIKAFTPKNIEEIPKMIEKKIEFNEVIGKKIDYDDIFDLKEEIQEEIIVEESEKVYSKATGEVKKAKEEEIIKLKSMSVEKAIKLIIKKMIDKNPESNIKTPDSFLEIKENKNKIFEKSKKEGDDYKNQPLFEIINFLSKNLYLKLFQQCTNLETNELCAVIAIDICRTIDKKSKLYHTIIATAMAQLFYSIEIPYSIVVFCDYGVQLVIKDFEDPHSNDISQLIFDSIMVERFSTRIFDACYYISKYVNCKNRINKRIFIISNGIDTKLKIGEKWLPMFGKDSEKFCFYFILPYLCNDIEKNEIIKIWNDFKEKTKVDIAIIINLNEILKGLPSTYQEFQKVMHYKIIKNFENKNYKVVHPEFKDCVQFNKEEFMKILSSINAEITSKLSHIYFVQNKSHIPSKNKYINEDFNIKNPFSTFKGDCIDNNYNSQAISEDTKIVLEKLFSSNTAAEMKLEYIDFVFPPNKPSLYSPSTKGSKLYLMGLINFCITHGQDNKIWLEKNRGLKKDYRVSVIIDSSISCFNDFMKPHSIKTVLAVLRMLSLVEIPFFDLIIAASNKPMVLTCGYDTISSLNPKSNLWNLVLEQLTHNENGCNLLDALKLSYKLKSMNNVKKWYCFVLTDGMFEQNEIDEIQDYVSFCEESYIDVFGIGLGYYPGGIKKIFNKCLWCLNPFMILKAMTVFFGSTEKYCEELPLIKLENQKKEEEALKNLGIITEKFYSYQQYKELYRFLDKLDAKIECFEEITNPDLADKIGHENPEISESNTMCKKGEFEGFKILIGQFWDNSLSEKESEWVDKRYL